MPNEFADIFSDGAFATASLTAAINKLDRIPGHAGRFAFGDTGNADADFADDEGADDESAVVTGIKTTKVGIEYKDETINLIANAPRGAPAEKEGRTKSNLIAFEVPHFPLQDTIQADEVQGVREFGTTEPKSVESFLNAQLSKIIKRHDLTLEHLRLGAIKGQVLNRDGAVLLDVFESFGVMNSDGQYAPEVFDFDLDNWTASYETVRQKCQSVRRFMKRAAKTPKADSAPVFALCGDQFFDKLTEHPSVRSVYDGTASAAERLGDDYVNGAFEFAGITFINYVGTDDNSTVSVGADAAHFFFGGMEGELFRQFNAPANFIEAVNKPGLPLYAKVAGDQRFNQSFEIHTEQNPLPLCLRPRTLVKGVVAQT